MMPVLDDSGFAKPSDCRNRCVSGSSNQLTSLDGGVKPFVPLLVPGRVEEIDWALSAGEPLTVWAIFCTILSVLLVRNAFGGCLL